MGNIFRNMNLKTKKRKGLKSLKKDLKSSPNNAFFKISLANCDLHFISNSGKLMGSEFDVEILKGHTPVAFHKYLKVDPNY